MIRTTISRLIAHMFAPLIEAEVAKRIPVITPQVRNVKIHEACIARSMLTEQERAAIPQIKSFEPLRGVVPEAKKKELMAMDTTDYAYANEFYGGAHFKGYSYLATLSQKPEYRKMTETIAKEMTRRFITLRSSGDDEGNDKADKIARIEKVMKKLKVRKHFRKVAEHDGFFGRGNIFIDVAKPGSTISAREDADELSMPLILDSAKITKGSLLGIRPVEPMWTYPSAYNASQPLAPNYYRPSHWYVMGQEVHGTRLMRFVSRDVPDILKAAYNFGGIPLSQLAEPYVEHWLRTRDSVSDMVHSFSINGIKTNMSGALQGGDGAQMFNRAQLFNNLRDNRGVFMLDKDTEDFFQFNTPLTGLDALQAQAQEQLASVASIPLVKLLGITPSGLNASSDGEIRVFYDYIKSMQEDLFRDPLEVLLQVIQLSEFGTIDPDITFDFAPLWEPTETEQAANQKTKAETGQALIASGVISPEEERERIAEDPASDYHSIEIAANVPLGEPLPDDLDDEPQPNVKET